MTRSANRDQRTAANSISIRSPRRRGQLLALGSEEYIGADHERICSQLDQGCKDRIEIAIGARLQNMELQPQGAGRRLHGSQIARNARIGGVDEQSNDGRRGYQFAQQLQPLRPYLHVQRRYSREVAAGSVQAGNKSNLDRVARYRKDDRNGVAALAATAVGVPPPDTITAPCR